MALNKFMHPRNAYKTKKPDFKQLAEKYEYFKEKVSVNVSGKVILDFKDPGSLRALPSLLSAGWLQEQIRPFHHKTCFFLLFLPNFFSHYFSISVTCTHTICQVTSSPG